MSDPMVVLTVARPGRDDDEIARWPGCTWTGKQCICCRRGFRRDPQTLLAMYSDGSGWTRQCWGVCDRCIRLTDDAIIRAAALYIEGTFGLDLKRPPITARR